jgi:hypothetical protein
LTSFGFEKFKRRPIHGYLAMKHSQTSMNSDKMFLVFEFLLATKKRADIKPSAFVLHKAFSALTKCIVGHNSNRSAYNRGRKHAFLSRMRDAMLF